MDGNRKPEERPEEVQEQGQTTLGSLTPGWKVTDEEIDRVIKKLEEGWGF